VLARTEPEPDLDIPTADSISGRKIRSEPMVPSGTEHIAVNVDLALVDLAELVDEVASKSQVSQKRRLLQFSQLREKYLEPSKRDRARSPEDRLRVDEVGRP